jgi:hypothetical protein
VKRVTTYFDDDYYDYVRELAKRKQTSMSALLRYSLDLTFEDDIDVIAAEMALAEAERDPSSTISLDDYMKQRGLRIDS